MLLNLGVIHTHCARVCSEFPSAPPVGPQSSTAGVEMPLGACKAVLRELEYRYQSNRTAAASRAQVDFDDDDDDLLAEADPSPSRVATHGEVTPYRCLYQ